eukprot:6965370-Pyramimonas_sp.AAC.1
MGSLAARAILESRGRRAEARARGAARNEPAGTPSGPGDLPTLMCRMTCSISTAEGRTLGSRSTSTRMRAGNSLMAWTTSARVAARPSSTAWKWDCICSATSA